MFVLIETHKTSTFLLRYIIIKSVSNYYFPCQNMWQYLLNTFTFEMQILCESIRAWTVTSLLFLLIEIKSALLKSSKILSVTKFLSFINFLTFRVNLKFLLNQELRKPYSNGTFFCLNNSWLNVFPWDTKNISCLISKYYFLPWDR